MRGAEIRLPKPASPATSSIESPLSGSRTRASTLSDGTVALPQSNPIDWVRLVFGIFLRDDREHIGGIRCLHEALPKLHALEETTDARKRFQMRPRRAL